jgi:hypothetical protein
MAADRSRGYAGFPRRSLLEYASWGAMGAFVVGVNHAAAQVKVSKQVVAYQDHPDGSKRCDRCAQFAPPDACKVVQGPIVPSGSCRLFVLKRQQANDRPVIEPVAPS